jgi:6,7-dimethyl-8-ribityllumazine synthase
MSTYSPEIDIPKGIHLNQDAFIVIIKTQWNHRIIQELEKGCIRVLDENKIAYQIIEVPGAFEIPFIIKKYWETVDHKKMPSAFIALGCVLRGDTPHFEFVSKAITDGILQLNLSLPVPTIFGVLTVDSEIQALERIGGIHGHKGEEAAITAIKMIATVENFYT